MPTLAQRKKVPTYAERLQRMDDLDLDIQVQYWDILIDRYEAWKEHFKLAEAKENLRLVQKEILHRANTNRARI